MKKKTWVNARKYKKKAVQSRDIRLFLPGSTERQAGRDGKTVVMNFVRIWHGFKENFACI